MNEILIQLQKLPKGQLLPIIFQLMCDGNISYHELTEMHVARLELLRKGQDEHYGVLKRKIIETFADSKKNYDKNIKNTMHYLLDCGEVNLTHGQIDAK